ncbi:N-6 DNA methylase [Stenotrophomonas sp. TWI1149]|uniref:class I SAM-dependent DNA methyltransferase n=1 Tax=unclassified Stenotrophomonas TaxID=196198 RepID=UPI00320897C3
MSAENFVQKIWELCHVLRGDGVSYHEYVSELTYLLFLKIAKENKTEDLIPAGRRWDDLANYKDGDLLDFYREMLTYLGAHADSDTVRKIYAFPTTVFSHSENLKAVIDGIAKLDWLSVKSDGMGDIYEGLLAKNSQDARSGAGQYFTPRALVDCMVNVMKPTAGEVIQDPAAGTGGFLISADHYIRARTSAAKYDANPPVYEGVEIEKGTYRICLMNSFLHRLNARVILGDALTSDANGLSSADLILANPPFGSKGGSARKIRKDISFSTTNKQLAFLQHIYLGLKVGGRAAVVLPDNALAEDGAGRLIRQELMNRCDLRAILRLPSGIFYSPGVKTNVLFFERAAGDQGGTREVFIYDMRDGSTRYGKKRPLRDVDFLEFEGLYDQYFGLHGGARNEIKSERWRSFTREEIAANDDNLNISWLSGADIESEDAPSEPEDIAAAIILHLRAALNEVELVADELSERSEGRL